MRTGKELILATKVFAKEDRKKSWFEVFITIFFVLVVFPMPFLNTPLWTKLIASVICGLLYVRMFVIYHDYQHHTILQKSKLAEWIMTGFGIYLLAPRRIWKRSHDHHHNNNSKLSISGIGSYPTICKDRFQKLSKKQKRIYLINRHPLTIIFGYVTLFIYWLNVKSFVQSPKKHLDSLAALLIHLALSIMVFMIFGPEIYFIGWFAPFFLAFGIGSYLFYCQHNFPKAKFRENHDWTYDNAALSSTSFMEMNPIMHWFTGDIGFHHVHHMNSRIPFYRLREVMAKMPELQNPPTTSWNPMEIYRCFRLKLWDPEKDKMITLKEL
ncbi:fatty acid desaturase family protein [Flexithrix dorotheae]|uniref:fatty acid desaturase family protein n=1 Tax=Flexithrix dorotheae TaxID=70993 RepID=UPI00037EB3D3|nr:fatty acid desaturase [Flexithrix dorotheae]